MLFKIFFFLIYSILYIWSLIKWHFTVALTWSFFEMLVNILRSTGQVLMFLLHSLMQSKQKTCSQMFGIPTFCLLNFRRQIGHFSPSSELPSESEESEFGTTESFCLALSAFLANAWLLLRLGLSSSLSLTQSDSQSALVSLAAIKKKNYRDNL